MTSSPPVIDTQINLLGTTVPPINLPVLVTPINTLAPTQHVGTLFQNSFGINLPPGIILGTNLPYNAPTHHTGRPIPSIPFPDLA